MVSHAGTPATMRNTLQKTTKVDLNSREPLLLQAELPFNDAGRLGPQLTLACELVLRGGWGDISEERHFDGIFVVTII